MRSILVFTVAGVVSVAQVLDLPVRYDPFHKAKKIIKKAQVFKNGASMGQRSLRLLAIFNGKAYIDGKRYRVGDRVGGATIVAIKEKYVLLRQNGTIRLLPLLGRKPILRVKR